MAVDKITFADKVSMIESTLPVINRIRDIDVNEIKDVVNNNADELTTANTNISTINTKIGALKVFYNGWSTSITFTLPTGHIALVMSMEGSLYQLWNPDDKLNVNAITGSDLSFTRAADKTTITGTSTKSGNTTWTVLVL